MLEASEIEKLIKQKQPLPPKSDSFEKFYYYALDICIELYRQKKIRRDELRYYRLEYKSIYEDLQLWLKILNRHREIEKLLGHAELNIDGCKKCKQIARFIDGRYKT